MILVKCTLNRMTSLEAEQVILLILFLSTETDHRVTRKWKLLSFSDL